MEQIPWWQDVARVLVRLLPVLALAAWSLWAIDWRRAWPYLAAGGWVPLVLVAAMAVFVWTRISPGPLRVGDFWILHWVWHTAAVALLVGLVLACGWLQGRLGAYPPEITFDPPPPGESEHAHHDHAPPVTISHPTH